MRVEMCTICFMKQDSHGEFHPGWDCRAVPEKDVEAKHITFHGLDDIKVLAWESIERCATRAKVLERK